MIAAKGVCTYDREMTNNPHLPWEVISEIGTIYLIVHWLEVVRDLIIFINEFLKKIINILSRWAVINLGEITQKL